MSNKIVPNYEEMEKITAIFSNFGLNTEDIKESDFSDMLTDIFGECLEITFKDIIPLEVLTEDKSVWGDVISLPTEEQLELKV